MLLRSNFSARLLKLFVVVLVFSISSLFWGGSYLSLIVRLSSKSYHHASAKQEYVRDVLSFFFFFICRFQFLVFLPSFWQRLFLSLSTCQAMWQSAVLCFLFYYLPFISFLRLYLQYLFPLEAISLFSVHLSSNVAKCCVVLSLLLSSVYIAL